MIKVSDQFRLDVSLEDASRACREAIAGMDWDLESIESDRLVLRRRMTFSRDSSKIEVLVSEAGPDLGEKTGAWLDQQRWERDAAPNRDL